MNSDSGVPHTGMKWLPATSSARSRRTRRQCRLIQQRMASSPSCWLRLALRTLLLAQYASVWALSSTHRHLHRVRTLLHSMVIYQNSFLSVHCCSVVLQPVIVLCEEESDVGLFSGFVPTAAAAAPAAEAPAPPAPSPTASTAAPSAQQTAVRSSLTRITVVSCSTSS